MKITFKLSLYLILRVLMICMLCFMCVPLTVSDGFSWLIPVLAVFYLVVLFYFVVFTCWTIGCKDKIKVDAGRQKSNMARGFISSGIVFGILEVLFILSIVITEGLAGQIFNVANMITSFFSYFLLMSFVGTSPYPGSYGILVYSLLIIACIITGGISYIIGAKNIKFIQPWLDKWKK